uniref:C-type lectin domain-containing protein n=1 Tax=Acanthochromis polyacanthus TaxID=80966 RepID=A0A3Q1GKN4_9TELE
LNVEVELNSSFSLSDHKCSSCTRSFAPLAVCWLILLGIIGLRIYFTAVISENNARLTAAEWNLIMIIEKMNAQNQELEMDKNNLTQQIQNWKKFKGLSTDVIYLLVSVVAEHHCEPCQKGWLTSQSNCYAIINPTKLENLRTWEEAQEDCSGKNSDLAVVVTTAEKNFVNAKSWIEKNLKQYWIGLRAVDGIWKWIDGSNLTETSWMSGQSATEGSCAVSIQNQGWKSVSCTEKNRWICQKKALSV